MMNRKIMSSVCAVMIAITLQAQEFNIKGKFSKIDSGKKAVLTYQGVDGRMVDSVEIRNGEFHFTGIVNRPVKAALRIKSTNDSYNPRSYEEMMTFDQQEFYLQSGAHQVTGDDQVASARITGNPSQTEYALLQKQLQPLKDRMAPLSKQVAEFQKNGQTEEAEQIFPKLREIRMEMNQVEDAFVRSHPDSYVSFDMIKSKAVVIEPATFEPLFNGLSDRLRNTDDGKRLAEELANAKRLDIGQPAMDFTQNDTEGKPVSLSSLKGKYVLIDFWASWCGPCRAENPHVVKAYQNFKDKNFEIIAVSLDDNKDAWLKAIKDDQLPWIHVSDLKGWKNEVSTAYGVRAVPQNYLLGPDGKILAKNLRGEKLEEELQKWMK